MYWFNANGEGSLYIGSADLMPRNLDRRIEVLTPILDPNLRRMLRDEILETHLCDNLQAWGLQSDATYRRLTPSSAEQGINSQEIMIKRYAR